MSNNTTEDQEREEIEIEMLLPWYVTGRLAPADRSRVETYLATHPSAAFALDCARAERQQTVIANEALTPPSADAFKALAGAGPQRPPKVIQRASRSLLAQAVLEFFRRPKPHHVRTAALATAALVIAQAAAIGWLLSRDGPATYQVALGENARDGVYALVVFADEARVAEIARVLAEFDGSIVDGPKPGGVYKLRLGKEDKTRADADVLLHRLSERRGVVRVVLPSMR
jgi:anti-sigma factor RsiW